MIKKITVQELHIGMWIVSTGLAQEAYPTLYQQEGELDSQEKLDAVLKQYKTAFIDTCKGSYAFEQETQTEGEEELCIELEVDENEALSIELEVDEDVHPPEPPQIPLAQEISNAEGLYGNFLLFAQEFMQKALSDGQVDYKRSQHFVQGVLSSIQRNRNALPALTKLDGFAEYTYTHAINVAILAVASGDYFGMPADELEQLGVAGLLLDIGKVLIPDRLLNKSAKLTENEFGRIKGHTLRGYQILQANSDIPQSVLRGVLEHHECYDGTGYPRQLSGDAIHPFARILSLADVYDALTSPRAYKPAMLPNKALALIYGMRGKNFYPGMAEKFIKFMGIYPIGAFVRLSNRKYGVVVAINKGTPLAPVVRIGFGHAFRPIPPYTFDLARQATDGPVVAIEESVDPEPHQIDVKRFLTEH